MGFKDQRFAKPAVSFVGPSRFIYIAGLGDQLKTDKAKLVDFFSQFGELEDTDGDQGIYMPEGKRFIFVTFVEIQVAEQVYSSLEADPTIPPLNANNLQVKYAQLASTKKSTEPECTSSTDGVHVPGLVVVENFITEEEESDMMQFYSNNEWKVSLQRRVQHYGYIFNYRTLMVDYVRPCPALPAHVPPLSDRIYNTYEAMASSNSVPSIPLEELRINQLTVNEYEPGQGIAPHVDTEACFGKVLFVLNLNADIVMALTKYTNQAVETRKFVHLPRRSLVILADEARYLYSHSISPRRFDKVQGSLVPRQTRVSLTLRHVIVPHLAVKGGLVKAAETSASTKSDGVDSDDEGAEDSLSKGIDSVQMEEEYVHKVYNTIAMHWHHTRGKRKVHWNKVKTFINSLPRGSIVADVGCGDGKYFNINPDIQIIGCDRSIKLLEVSKILDEDNKADQKPQLDPFHESFCCDALSLPFRSATFDATLCIAVLHHISSVERRLQVISELLRITKDGGLIYIQAWAQEQEKDSKHVFNEQDIFVPWKLNKRFAVGDKTEKGGKSKQGKADKEEQDEITVYNRYCHVYKEKELEDLCSCLPHSVIVESGYDKGNWYVQLMKRQDDRLGVTTGDEVHAIPTKVIRNRDNI